VFLLRAQNDEHFAARGDKNGHAQQGLRRMPRERAVKSFPLQVISGAAHSLSLSGLLGNPKDSLKTPDKERARLGPKHVLTKPGRAKARPGKIQN